MTVPRLNVRLLSLPDPTSIFGSRGVLGEGNIERFAKLALNNTANILRGKAYDQMRSKFNNPREYTVPREYNWKRPTRKGSIFVKPLKRAEVPTTTVGLKDEFAVSAGGIPPSKYLAALITGGPRNAKRSEKKLSAGITGVPGGVYYVPGRDAKLDKSGDFSRGTLQKIFSGLRIADQFRGSTQNESVASRKRKGRKAMTYYVIKPSTKSAGRKGKRNRKEGPSGPGVYAVTASGQRLQLLRFVKRPDYTASAARINPIKLMADAAPQVFVEQLNDVIDFKTGLKKRGSA